ncbi:MAG: hypothetical protein AUK36_02485 [Zetaproteobacteria bacterium CG2_30_59_37]|nr:MAG: hypothetical protein AUK36_02485 [Zetaproteobacteria bacterium CG2_30_59_37]
MKQAAEFGFDETGYMQAFEKVPRFSRKNMKDIIAYYVGFSSLIAELGFKNYQLGKQVDVLSGLVPICSHCKKVRDDQGYWEHIEDYLTEHSGAVVSHGLCPDCAHELYPNLECTQKHKH